MSITSLSFERKLQVLEQLKDYFDGLYLLDIVKLAKEASLEQEDITLITNRYSDIKIKEAFEA